MSLNYTFKIINHLLNQVTSFCASHMDAEAVDLNAYTSNSWFGIWKPQRYVIIIVSYSRGKCLAAAVNDVIRFSFKLQKI